MKHSPLLLLVLAAACSSNSNSGGSDLGYQFAIPLTTPDETLWNAAVTAGSATFELDLDTGSTTVGIAGTACGACDVSPEYTPSASAVDQGSSSSTEYEDGSMWSGEIYKETISLGEGTPPATLNIVDISAQNDFFFGNEYQGILGMGPPENAEPDTGAYFHTITAGSAVDPIMAFELCDDGGTMWFGGYDPTHADGDILYTPMLPIAATELNYNPFYSINVDSMSIGGTVVGQGADTFEEPVLDTGTTLYYVPTGVFNNVLSAVNAGSGFQALFPGQTFAEDQFGDGGCTNTSSVTEDQINAMLPPLVLNLPNFDGGSDISFSVPPLESYIYDAGGGQFCIGIGDGGTQEASTFGDQFLQGFVTVIDLDKGRVGFALDKGCSEGSGASHRRTHEAVLDHPRLPRPRVRR